MTHNTVDSLMNALFFFQNTNNRSKNHVFKHDNANPRNVSAVVGRIGNGKARSHQILPLPSQPLGQYNADEFRVDSITWVLKVEELFSNSSFWTFELPCSRHGPDISYANYRFVCFKTNFLLLSNGFKWRRRYLSIFPICSHDATTMLFNRELL